MQGIVEFVRTLGASRLVAMAAVTLALVGFFAFLIMRVTAPHMTTLFPDLAPGDAAAIVKELERQGIAYDLRNDGSTVLVAKDQMSRARMKLAESGLPKGGSIGYEIFDKSDTLGATSFLQNINHLRALEGELTRSIRALDRVQDARVHLVLPERPLFARDKAEPSASIVLKLRGGLDQSQVRAIRHLVASAVNGLKPERVSIIDETGRLLATGAGDDAAGSGSTALERQQMFERKLREQVELIVSSVVGPGRARVQLTADFDLNRVTQTSDTFDPEGRVVRSSQSREESSLSNDGKEGQVSVGNELPGAAQPGATATPKEQTKKSEETINYEISRTTKTEVIEGGRVKRISAAVLVDGSYLRNDKGELVYQQRAAEEIDRIAALVRTAIGFDQKRGDQVEVVNLRFAETPAAPVAEAAPWFGLANFSKDDVLRAVELGVMSLLGFIVILFVVRPLVRRIVTPEGSVQSSAPALAGPAEAAPGDVAVPVLPANATKMIEIAQVQGQLHAQSMQKIGELAERNPNETVSIMREWLTEAPARP